MHKKCTHAHPVHACTVIMMMKLRKLHPGRGLGQGINAAVTLALKMWGRRVKYMFQVSIVGYCLIDNSNNRNSRRLCHTLEQCVVFPRASSVLSLQKLELET